MFRTSHKLSALALALLSCAAQAQSLPDDASRVAQLRANAEGLARAFPGLSLDSKEHTYELRNVVVDDDGASHVRLDRRINGLRAIGADLIVQTDRFGNLATMHRSVGMLNAAALPARATFTATRAVRSVADAFPGGTVSKNPEQVIWAREDQPRLAWEVLVSGESADGTPYEKHVIVDATNGQQIDVWDEDRKSVV